MIDAVTGTRPQVVSRRHFGKHVALAATTGTLLSPALRAQREASPPPVRVAASKALPATDQAAVEAKYASVIRKYGTRLSAAQRARVRATLVEHQRMLMRIRLFALENSDAPATGLRLYPSDIQPVGAFSEERDSL